MTVDAQRVHDLTGIAAIHDVGELGGLVLRAARRALAAHLVEVATRAGTTGHMPWGRIENGRRI